MGERLEHQGRRLDVLGAAGEIGIDGRRRLPVQDVEAAVAATLGVGAVADTIAAITASAVRLVLLIIFFPPIFRSG